MNHRERFLDYLRLYEAKDLARITDMFAENIVLRDWNISVKGKAAALEETAANFANAKSLRIVPLHVYEREGAVAGELHITVDGSVELYVVDVLEFDAEGRIAAIRAYLGRAD